MKCKLGNATECVKNGCCVESTNTCYHPMDGKQNWLKMLTLPLKTLIMTDCLFVECTADQHFVFEIRNNIPSVFVNPKKLYISGHPECKPVFVNDMVAIFKFGVKECGVRAYVSCFCFSSLLCLNCRLLYKKKI